MRPFPSAYSRSVNHSGHACPGHPAAVLGSHVPQSPIGSKCVVDGNPVMVVNANKRPCSIAWSVMPSRAGVFFIPADTSIAVEASDDGLELWLAGVNSNVFKRGARPHHCVTWQGIAFLARGRGTYMRGWKMCVASRCAHEPRGFRQFSTCPAVPHLSKYRSVDTKHACTGGSKLSQAEAAAQRVAREASSSSWVLLAAIGLALLLLWAKLLPHLPWLQQELTKWHSLSAGGAANARPT